MPYSPKYFCVFIVVHPSSYAQVLFLQILLASDELQPSLVVITGQYAGEFHFALSKLVLLGPVLSAEAGEKQAASWEPVCWGLMDSPVGDAMSLSVSPTASPQHVVSLP